MTDTSPPLTSSLPVVALSLGDPGGIGPEIIAACARDQEILSRARLLCFGDREALLAGARARGEALVLHSVSDDREEIPAGALCLVETTRLPAAGRVFGRPNPGAGLAQRAYLDAALEAVLAGRADALCTAPVTKSLVHREAGPFSGHTGYLASRLGERAVMMLASDVLRVVLYTEHIPLRRVSEVLEEESLVRTLVTTARALREDFGLSHPRLAVCALNPHAGEEGLLGSEEIEIIGPAVEKARKTLGQEASVFDPKPADSLFTPQARASYDAVLCLYHDQGLIPLKALSARSAVNVTLGLSLVRTSPDHGTAYDIAGRGVADPSSMKQAILLAAEIATRRKEKALRHPSTCH